MQRTRTPAQYRSRTFPGQGPSRPIRRHQSRGGPRRLTGLVLLGLLLAMAGGTLQAQPHPGPPAQQGAGAGAPPSGTATPEPKPDGIEQGDSPECMRCHWMETMAYRDRETRKIVDLSVDAHAYRQSVHAALACGDCHDRGYKHYPHRTTSADEALTCVGCHAERGDDGAPDLAEIGIEYKESVHAEEAPAKFDCFSCHDPHRFHPVPDTATVQEVVASNNQLCLDCHTELDTPVPRGHDWLPKPREHWAAVRCIDCHTPVEGRAMYQPSHVLLSGDESNQNCVECHSQGSELLTQLYSYRVESAREDRGLVEQALYNDAYIIGMSRSPLIDGIGLVVILLTVLGVAAHGLGRWLGNRKRKGTS